MSANAPKRLQRQGRVAIGRSAATMQTRVREAAVQMTAERKMDVLAPPLKVRKVSKRFAGTLALDEVDLEVRRGEIHALLGENGAGKSTLIKILAGVHRADSGQISLHDQPVDPATEKLPIAFIHQELGLVDTMTVTENIAMLAGYPRRFHMISWAAAQSAAESAIALMGGGVDPDARVGDLPAAEKSIVAIARAIAIKSDFLVLDEPTAALPEADVARLHAVLRRLRASGLGIIYVTHRLDEVFRIADRVTVLRDGRWVTTRKVSDTTPESLVHDIVGRPLSNLFAPPPAAAGDIVLSIHELVADGVGPVDLDVFCGEIIGLVGLRGAGHDIVGRAIFGDVAITSGSIALDGQVVGVQTPEGAVRKGIGFVSSKRTEESLASTLTVQENLFPNPAILGFGPFGPINPVAERSRCHHALRRFAVRPPQPHRQIVTLSGGNQQKVVVARWLEANSRLLILEEPTFGVDVGAKAEIYRLLLEALERGLAVILVSSDFEEVAGISSRALVFDRGRVTAELARRELSVARLTAVASGA
jgi:ribose transport system ATP-binding protein